jgi:hypothetical protein
MNIGAVLVDSILQEAVDQADGGSGVFRIGTDNVGGGDILEIGGGLVLAVFQVL